MYILKMRIFTLYYYYLVIILQFKYEYNILNFGFNQVTFEKDILEDSNIIYKYKYNYKRMLASNKNYDYSLFYSTKKPVYYL